MATGIRDSQMLSHGLPVYLSSKRTTKLLLMTLAPLPRDKDGAALRWRLTATTTTTMVSTDKERSSCCTHPADPYFTSPQLPRFRRHNLLGGQYEMNAALMLAIAAALESTQSLMAYLYVPSIYYILDMLSSKRGSLTYG